MKIQGLKQDDFDKIDTVFCYFMAQQALQIKGAVNAPELCRDNIEALEDTLKVYEKIEKEMRKYEKQGKLCK